MNLRIACCISGLPTPQIIEHVQYLVKYKSQMDFFVFLWDTIDNTHKKKIETTLQPVDIIYQTPIIFPFDASFKEPDKNGSKNDAISMFYGISQVQRMRRTHEAKINKRYDIVIRFRYDIHMMSDLLAILNRAMCIIDNKTVVFPWERHHIGICDQLFFGKSEIMDKFIDIFEWIKMNANTLYFVNENIMYQFISKNNIMFKCMEIQYVLRREHLVGAPHNAYVEEYVSHSNLPWIRSCPEKRDVLSNLYIDMKNDSANNVYFMTNGKYNDVTCKIFNPAEKKYIRIISFGDNVNATKYSSRISNVSIIGSQIHTHLKLRIYDACMINIILDTANTQCLSAHGNRLMRTNNTNDERSRFFLIRKTKSDNYIHNNTIVYNLVRHCAGSSTNTRETFKTTCCKNFLCMRTDGNIYSDGEHTEPGSEWNIIISPQYVAK